MDQFVEVSRASSASLIAGIDFFGVLIGVLGFLFIIISSVIDFDFWVRARLVGVRGLLGFSGDSAAFFALSAVSG